MSLLPPDADFLVEESKMADYLLNAAHPVGGPKAKFFNSLGFDIGNPGAFSEALKEHGRTRPIIEETPTDFGTKYQLECSMPSPSGTNRCVRSVWIREQGNRFRLITAHPLPGK